MKRDNLFLELLELTEDWFVDSIVYDDELKQVHLTVSYTKEEGLCPITSELSPVYDYRKSRKWQHLSLFEYTSFIHCRIPRVKNSLGKVSSIKVPWADDSQRHTNKFENRVIDILQSTHNQTKAAKLLDVSFDVVNLIMHKSVKRGLLRREFKNDELIVLGIDEKSFKKGHNYVSILVDMNIMRIIDVVEGRDKKATEKLITDNLNESQKQRVKAVSMDMWESYMLIVEQLLPNSDIVHDKFHIIQYLNKAIDSERKKEVKKDDVLKGSKYVMLKNKCNLTDKQKKHFDEIMVKSLETGKAYSFRESFRSILSVNNITEAKSLFKTWISEVRESSLFAMKKVANMVESHLEGILNYIKHRITNAKTERFNGKIQTLKNISRGYKSFINFRSAILFFNGKLDLKSY